MSLLIFIFSQKLHLVVETHVCVISDFVSTKKKKENAFALHQEFQKFQDII